MLDTSPRRTPSLMSLGAAELSEDAFRVLKLIFEAKIEGYISHVHIARVLRRPGAAPDDRRRVAERGARRANHDVPGASQRPKRRVCVWAFRPIKSL